MTDATGQSVVSDRLKLLPQTSSDSLMGQLLRKFWQPVTRSQNVQIRKAIPVRILGETLTVYRGASGKPYLVAGHCPHRRTLLHTGWVVSETIKCMYHGWQFNGAGQCVERPAEDATRNASVRITSYPLHEYAGLIFVYMGPGDPPEFQLPRKPHFEAPDTMLFVREETWPCNWFQQVENSLDAVHVSFVHHWGEVGTFGGAVAPTIPQLEYEETDAGIRQTATRSANSVRVSNWTFPNNNHIITPGLTLEDPWVDIGIWMTPLDDEHTTRFVTYAIKSTTPENDKRIRDYFDKFGDYNPADHHDDLIKRGILPDDDVLQLTSAQDYVAAVGQGTIADRLNERLGQSDRGITFLRRLFWREMELIREGRATKPWHRLKEAPVLPKQIREDAPAEQQA
ncbi:Rieske 2Fe-2S domain-containing protein [Roseiarcaceae bacterium H3SJ34-1]|uniref:Rieske 2Fe-2S domain-containing protein n=1 Tax=Terripilifer ovatus TaxID=3032367 RepID=UPI003AB94718|nr:Rieske 2Fe-2S domain-containing protein [Roseiarcaceae bacterium H3SJ34-1]